MRRHLVLFVRAPALGIGKRRLARDIGDVAAVRFERLMIALLLRRLAGYGILNLTVEWDVAKGWTGFARANNVFDQDYQLAADFSTGGATLFAGLRWRP